MTALQIRLSDTTRRRLQQLAQRVGKSESEIIDEALQRFMEQDEKPDRLALLRQARGMWKDRDDLPDAAVLRREWDRKFRQSEDGES